MIRKLVETILILEYVILVISSERRDNLKLQFHAGN